VLSGIPELNKSDIGETFVPSVYRFTRNNEEREMLQLGLVKPNSYARPYAMPPGVPVGSRARRGSGFPENAERSGVRRRSRENANDLNPIPGTTLHNMIVEGLSMPPTLKEKLKPILAPKG
jgi:hypothetical protein